jgi:hypothetical protein
MYWWVVADLHDLTPDRGFLLAILMTFSTELLKRFVEPLSGCRWFHLATHSDFSVQAGSLCFRHPDPKELEVSRNFRK